MGVCCTHAKNITPTSHKEMNTSASALLHYPRTVRLHILTKDEKQKVLTDEQLQVNLTEPSMAFSQQISMGKWKVWASGCILPGLDPRGHDKTCQDLIFLESFKGFTLAGVLDGHGPNGEQVVSYIKRYAYDFFIQKQTEIDSDPTKFLSEMTEACDVALQKEESMVDCLASGSTAVFLMYSKEVVYFASVGDSRAILATSHPPDVLAATQPPRGEDRALLHELKVRRSVSPDIDLIAVQMTVDQKPEDPSELARIQQSGGVVMRLEDENGKRVGPYRVWKVENIYPGIAMSRSLGDRLAHEIGVISTPIITSRELKEGEDCFIVIGSDGLWDMMENQEVCDFVEAFRQKSVRNITMPQYVDVVDPFNVSIAHLLCEEARARWLSIVEAEDVLIDDTSCLVLELITHLPSKKRAPPRNTAPRKDIEDVPGLEKGMRHAAKLVQDPVRSPTIREDEISALNEEQDTTPAVVINDPRRSSVSDFGRMQVA